MTEEEFVDNFDDLEVSDMDLVEDMIKFCITYVLENCPEEMKFFNQMIDKTLLERLDKVVNSNFTKMTYTEGINKLLEAKEKGYKFENNNIGWGMDLQSEHERYLCEQVVKGPMFLIDYPKDIKAFYMRMNDDGKTLFEGIASATAEPVMVIIEDGKCRIEKILFDTPVKLLSIPEKPQPIDEVLEELATLPDGEQNGNSPFLEVRVLITTIDPTIRQRIEEAIEGKAVRLARVEATSSITRQGEENKPMTYEDFKKIAPVALMKDIYKKETEKEMPEHLVKLLDEITKEVES